MTDLAGGRTLGLMLRAESYEEVLVTTDADLVQEMLGKMGRNLLRFQLIEQGLKFLLPLTHPDGSASGDDAYRMLKSELAQQTLGGLRGKLLGAMKTDNPEGFAAYLTAVVDNRNEFIHHFFEVPGVSLASASGYTAAVSYLDRQYDFAQPLFDLILQLSLDVTTLICERDNLGDFRRNVTSEGEPK